MFKKMLTLGLALCLVACNNTPNTPVPPNNPTVTEPAFVIEVVKMKNDAGAVIEEFEFEKNRQLKHGYYKSFYSNGQLLSTKTYKLGAIEGKELNYTDKGTLESELLYAKGLLEGEFKYFYPDGTLKQKGLRKADKIEGELLSYYPNGGLKESVSFKDGTEYGAFLEYNPNNTFKAKGEYRTDAEGEAREHGTLELYDEKGILKSKMDCDMGTCYTVWTAEKGDINPKKKPI
jgi:antitoxin component YwqK of YwqJK toxin-antitoxin module